MVIWRRSINLKSSHLFIKLLIQLSITISELCFYLKSHLIQVPCCILINCVTTTYQKKKRLCTFEDALICSVSFMFFRKCALGGPFCSSSSPESLFYLPDDAEEGPFVPPWPLFDIHGGSINNFLETGFLSFFFHHVRITV